MKKTIASSSDFALDLACGSQLIGGWIDSIDVGLTDRSQVWPTVRYGKVVLPLIIFADT
jgi:hypothetical protein